VHLSASSALVRLEQTKTAAEEFKMTESVQTVTPHLVVSDANAAIAFYKQALGATEAFRMPEKDGKRLLHAEINFNGARIFLVDDFPEYRGQHGVDGVFPPNQIGGTSITVHLEVENCDAAVKRAADAGATITQAPWDSFWGARYARIMDPFGHSWSFSHPLPQTT
jgi:PhnB protein